jgi:hypothetical protein
MLYREMIAVCSEIHTKHINTLCGQNVGFVDIKPDRMYTHRIIRMQHNATNVKAVLYSWSSIIQCDY